MRKGSILLILASFLFGMILWITPMEVKAEGYYWANEEIINGEEIIMIPGWYKGGHPGESGSVKMDEAPLGLTQEDYLYFFAEIDENNIEWLKNLNGNIAGIEFYCTEGDVQIGSPERELSLYSLVDYGNMDIVVYGNVAAVSIRHGNTTVNGNVEILTLGDQFYMNSPICYNGKVAIAGNVDVIYWNTTVESSELENRYYGGFEGDLTVSGMVKDGVIYSVVYDPAVENDIWQMTGKIGECAAGDFSIKSGVLAESVSVTEIKPQMGNYSYRYECYLTENGNLWQRIAFAEDSFTSAYREECQEEDVPADATISVDGIGYLTLNFDVDSLSVFPTKGSKVNITINGNVKRFGGGMFSNSESNINISGNVEDFLLMDYLYNPRCNFTIGGKVSGCYRTSTGNVSSVAGWFDAENMPIIQNGKWNPDIYMRTSYIEDTAVSFKPVHEDEIARVLPDGYNLGEEITVMTSEGQKTLVKSSGIRVSATEGNVLEKLTKQREMKEVLQELKSNMDQEEHIEVLTVPVCAVDIDINTYYMDKETGNTYEDENYKAQNIVQLKQGEKLALCVKIPPIYYDENAKYFVVRNHIEEDGTSSMVKIDTVQDGDILTFSSDKFSTFIIVRVEQRKNADDNQNEEEKPGNNTPSIGENQNAESEEREDEKGNNKSSENLEYIKDNVPDTGDAIPIYVSIAMTICFIASSAMKVISRKRKE